MSLIRRFIEIKSSAFSAGCCGLTCTSWSSQWERLKDLTLLTSGMLRWIPEQARQMNTPREQEPQLGSAEGGGWREQMEYEDMERVTGMKG